MASTRNIYDLRSLVKTSIDNNDYLETANASTRVSEKLLIASLFPSLSTTGTGGEDFYIDITNKNQLNFKGIKSGDTGLLTVTTATNNIVLTALEAGIDLSLCNNTTSLFSAGADFTGTVTGANPVVNGGTGLTTIVKGAMLYASAADTIAASSSMSTDGQLLIGNSATGIPSLAALVGGTNVTVTNTAGAISLSASLSTMASILDMDNYGIDLGTGWISGNGTAEGMRVDADGKVFIGEATPTAVFAEALNIKGSVRFTSNAAPTIKPTATTSTTVGVDMTIEAGSSASGAAGSLNLKAGTASGSAAGGDVNVIAGRDTAGGTDGSVNLKTYTGGTATTGLTIAAEVQDVTLPVGNLVITNARKGIIHTGSGTVTQATSHVTDVAINSTSGIITLAAVALAATTNAEFTIANDTVQADSVILLTMQDSNTVDNKQLACALVSVSDESFRISIVNPHSTSATSATASKIHFLVINNS